MPDSDGLAEGIATVLGIEESIGAGTAEGVATVSAAGAQTEYPGSAAGVATVTAEGQAAHVGVGSSAGIATVSAIASLSPQTEISFGNATENYALHHVVRATSTANATSPVVGFETQTEVSRAVATAPVIGTGLVALTLVSRGHSIATAVLLFPETLTSSADATAPVVGTGRVTNKLVSSAAATSPLSGVGRRQVTLVTSADATSRAAIALTEPASSTADAASNLVGTRIASNTETSSADASASALEGGRSLITLKSSSVGSAVVSGRLSAHQILLSSANATAYIVLPYGPRVAFWSNAVSTAAATWAGAPFETIIAADDVVYAAGCDGIYRMAKGVDDNGSPVAAELLWDLLDFGDPKKHRLGNVVIGALSAGPLNVRVINKQGRFDYPTHLPATTKATNLRAKLGKGLSARYNRLGLTNPGGRDFKFNAAAVEVVDLSRRVGGT